VWNICLVRIYIFLFQSVQSTTVEYCLVNGAIIVQKNVNNLNHNIFRDWSPLDYFSHKFGCTCTMLFHSPDNTILFGINIWYKLHEHHWTRRNKGAKAKNLESYVCSLRLIYDDVPFCCHCQHADIYDLCIWFTYNTFLNTFIFMGMQMVQNLDKCISIVYDKAGTNQPHLHSLL
jgi:hypothetical protein